MFDILDMYISHHDILCRPFPLPPAPSARSPASVRDALVRAAVRAVKPGEGSALAQPTSAVVSVAMERIGRVAGAWMLDNGREAAMNVAKEGVTIRQRGSVDVAKRRGLVAAVWAVVREVLSVMKSIVENPWVDIGILVVAVAALTRDGGWIRWKDKEDGKGDGRSPPSSGQTSDTVQSLRAEQQFSPITRTSSAPAISPQSSPSSRITSQQQHSIIDISSTNSQSFDPYHLLRASIRDDARFECLALTNRQQADDLERLKRIVSGLRREVGIRDERIARLEGIVEHLQGRTDVVEERLGRVEGDVDVMSELLSDDVGQESPTTTPIDVHPVPPSVILPSSMSASPSASSFMPANSPSSTSDAQSPLPSNITSDTHHQNADSDALGDWERVSNDSNL